MLANTPFTTRIAGDREAGARCPHCGVSIAFGEQIAGCIRCGAVHHVICWQSRDGCGSFECAPARRIVATDRQPDFRISIDDVSQVKQLPPRVSISNNGFVPAGLNAAPVGADKRSILAIVAVVIAACSVGLPIFSRIISVPTISGIFLIGGILGGLTAVVFGSLALGGIHRTGRRGIWFSATAILLGLGSMIGSVVSVLGPSIPQSRLAITMEDFQNDADALNHMIPTVARAVRANALIETKIGSGILTGMGIGSGVIMSIENHEALILTNRHVVDPNFDSTEKDLEKPGLPDGRLQVKLIGQASHPGHVVWIAPDEIDLALVRVEVDGTGARAAEWKSDTELVVGSEVFTVGNPEHLDWTHTRGSISQLRLQQRGDRKIHVIQTDAALNHGNSGGGLYDKAGSLIGINTWIAGNTSAQGLGFSIALKSLLELAPPGLHAPAEKAADKSDGQADESKDKLKSKDTDAEKSESKKPSAKKDAEQSDPDSEEEDAE